jgi:hypothetical protein
MKWDFYQIYIAQNNLRTLVRLIAQIESLWPLYHKSVVSCFFNKHFFLRVCLRAIASSRFLVATERSEAALGL